VSRHGHTSLWGSRFIPGLAHGLGPLWPLILLAFLAGVIGSLLFIRDRAVRIWAVAAAVAGLSYLVFPTGATDIQQGTLLFTVNLRYATPAFAIGVLLVPPILAIKSPKTLRFAAPLCLLLELSAQLEHPLWPSQTARHAGFVIATAIALLALWRLGRARLRRSLALASALVLACAGVAAADAVQRHYFARRYLVGGENTPGLSAIYRWAQPLTHARIALYGTVEQYPLTGARVTNRVDYLGQSTPSGGYAPIGTCRLWRQTINRDHAQYVVLTPAPTRALPIAWTSTDPSVTLILHPTGNDYVFRVNAALHPDECS
jgi:hypothetical protein